MKELLAVGATLLIIVAYTPYVKDTIAGKTRPHLYSWLISGLITFIVFGVQLNNGAGWGALPTFAAATAGLVVFLLSLNGKRAPITKSDSFFFAMALIATALWLIAHQPLTSVVIISLIEILAFAPTYRKSWQRPDQETLSAYLVNTLRFTLATISLQNYSLVTVLYPLTEALADGLFSLFLILRRRSLKILS